MSELRWRIEISDINLDLCVWICAVSNSSFASSSNKRKSHRRLLLWVKSRVEVGWTKKALGRRPYNSKWCPHSIYHQISADPYSWCCLLLLVSQISIFECTALKCFFFDDPSPWPLNYSRSNLFYLPSAHQFLLDWAPLITRVSYLSARWQGNGR